MIGLTITFKNHPTANGFETFSVDDCLVANNGTPNLDRPQILIHLPKTDNHDVNNSFVNYEGYDWHIIGTTVQQMDGNTPTRWNRYAIAERIKAL